MKHSITVVGLGAGDLEQLPLGVYRQLQNTDKVYLRTKEHPVVKELQQEGIDFESFDAIYEKHEQFQGVYEEIVSVLLEKVKEKSIIYAVPGHPLVAEQTVQLLISEAEKETFTLHIGGGQSFLDSLFAAVKADPIDGFQLLDGTQLDSNDIQMNQQLIIGQVYDSFIASEVKLSLMELYPFDYEVYLVTAAGSQEEKVEKLPLYELDRNMNVSNLTSLYVPAASNFEQTFKSFSTFKRIIEVLRGPNGCPWDREQTHQSLKKYLIEEAYEVLHAIDQDDIDNLIEELGDVMLQILLHAQIGKDEGMFTIEDVIESVSSKMVRRHPHVFGNTEAKTTEEVLTNWEEIKKKEKAENSDEMKSILKGVGEGMPALIKAFELQKKAAKVGFDWDNPKDAWKKVLEEIKEFEVEIENQDEQSQRQEYGDVLFSFVNFARFYDIYPEEALAAANEKFARRFRYIEEKVHETGKEFDQFTLEQLDQFWNEAKEKDHQKEL